MEHLGGRTALHGDEALLVDAAQRLEHTLLCLQLRQQPQRLVAKLAVEILDLRREGAWATAALAAAC